MTNRARLLPFAICVATLLGADSLAQTGERRPAGPPPPQAQEQTAAPASADPVANEIALLRKSLQSLNTRLREISEKLLAADVRQGGPVDLKQGPLAQYIDLLSRAEQRAEGLRKQLLELIEKETAFRNRLTQLDEDMRPDSIDRSLALVGTTRSTTDLREIRRRVLDTERRGVENLLSQTALSRVRLEEDVKQADAMVARIRHRLFPLIEKEIDKLNPNAN
jgi:hypothetical protein